MATRDQVLSDPRSGARPLGGSSGASSRPRTTAERGAAAFEAEEIDASRAEAEEIDASRAEAEEIDASRAARYATRPAAAPPATRRGRPPGSGAAGRAGRRAARAAGVTGSRTNYQAVVLGEFVLAVMAVAFPPIVRKNTAAVSPYSGLDMIQLAAITILYFFLAVLAGTGGERARFSAWFGGLIMLGVGLGETANLTSIVKANNAAAQAAAQPATNPTVGGSVPSTSTTTASGQPSSAGTTGSSNG